MIYCEKEKRWYQNDIHRKNEEALRLEVDAWKSEPCSLEEVLMQVKRLRGSFFV